MAAEVVVVHGILNQFAGSASVEAVWGPAIADGLRLAGFNQLPAVRCAFYGHLFRPRGAKSSGPPAKEDLLGSFGAQVLSAWWQSAHRHEPQSVPSPDSATKLRYPTGVQRAIRALLNSAFFRGMAGAHGDRALLFALEQVRRYFCEEETRRASQEIVRASLSRSTRAVIAHSLGSVVAYEALVHVTEFRVPVFVSLGSPLAVSPIVFDRLRPPPRGGIGAWPAVERWFNLADEGDVVALEKRLAPRFSTGGCVADMIINNGWMSHDVRHYLSAAETGDAIAHAFR